MPSKWILSGLVLLVLVLGYFAYQHVPVLEKKSPRQEIARNSSFPAMSNHGLTTAPMLSVVVSKNELQKRFSAEVAKIGQIDPNPSATAEALLALARSLDKSSLEWLRGVALDDSKNGDDRFFAAYLLAENGGQDSLNFLREVALSKIPPAKAAGQKELERQIRAQVTEGLGKNRSSEYARHVLEQVAVEQDDPFLRDQAHRALHEWKTGERIEDQEKDAIGKVLEKTGK